MPALPVDSIRSSLPKTFLRSGSLWLLLLALAVIAPRGVAQVGVMPANAVTGATLTAGPIPFPSDIMRSVKDYGAVGDGVTDDTAAILAAINDGRTNPTGNYYGNPKSLYFPPGTYMLSGALRIVGCCVTLQGDGVKTSILRLKPGTLGFNNSSAPQGLIVTPDGINSFHQNIRDLGISIGTNNPAAIGIDYVSNNSGAIQDVEITSDDGTAGGHAGVELTRKYIGPLLIKNVAINGFAIGFDLANGEYSATFEGITLNKQRVAGWRNVAQTISIRNVVSTSTAPVVTNDGGTVALLDGMLNGGSAANAAIMTNHASFFRHITSEGYGSTLLDQRSSPAVAVKGELTEYPLGTPDHLQDPVVLSSLNLPVEETPSYADADLTKWKAFKPGGYGDNSSLQATLDSGASTIYFPAGPVSTGYPDGAYFSYSAITVNVPDTVHRIIGFSSVINGAADGPGGGGITFAVNSSSPDPLVIEEFGYGLKVNQSGIRPVVIKHSAAAYTSNPGTATTFFEDVEMGNFVMVPGQHVWGRQVNMEAFGPNILNVGGTLWLLGLKTEAPGTVINTLAGGYTELLGGLVYPAQVVPSDNAAFRSADSQVSYIYSEPVYCDGCGYAHQIQEIRDGVAQQLNSSPNTFFTTPLFVGYNVK